MFGWHHRLDGHEFHQEMVKDTEDVCCGPRGHKELDTTERLNNYSNDNHHCGLTLASCLAGGSPEPRIRELQGALVPRS